MYKDSSRLQKITEELITDIDQAKKNQWEKAEEALFWIHGTTEIWEAFELEKWLFADLSLSETAKSPAIDKYLAWEDHIRECGDYTDFTGDDLPKPQEKEILIDYIIRLSRMIESGGWGSKKQRFALKSFLHFLRKHNHQEEVAFIEHIFPKKMNLFHGKIIRKIHPQALSIPQEIAAAIIKELAIKCACGRQNARHHAGEALALIWLCLSSARIRLPRTLESVHWIEKGALVFNKEYPELLAPSFFGSHPVRIGERIARFLQEAANIPSKSNRNTILQTPLPDLRKSLNAAIRRCNLPAGLGEITFVSFLSSPHPYGAFVR